MIFGGWPQGFVSTLIRTEATTAPPYINTRYHKLPWARCEHNPHLSSGILDSIYCFSSIQIGQFLNSVALHFRRPTSKPIRLYCNPVPIGVIPRIWLNFNFRLATSPAKTSKRAVNGDIFRGCDILFTVNPPKSSFPLYVRTVR